MYTKDFEKKLKRLNPHLYVDYRDARKASPKYDYLLTGIYLRVTKRDKLKYSKASYEGLSQEQRAYLRDKEAGHFDVHVGGVCLQIVPEYDIFDISGCQLLVPGYRSILLSLVKKGYVDLKKAKRVFACSSLGESDYDNQDFFGKIKLIKALRS